MVDVSDKPATARRAVAEAFVAMSAGDAEPRHRRPGAKGDVLTVAEMAGVMGAKRTSELIPLCHPIPLTDLVVEITPDRGREWAAHPRRGRDDGPTGVEMEALTAAAVAALTVYDMVKGVDRSVEIRDVRPRREDAAASPASGGSAATSPAAASRPQGRPGGGPDPASAKPEPRARRDARRRASAFVLTISDGAAAGTRDDETGARPRRAR